MSKQSYVIVIPARYASNRFPGKPLHLINAQPMILHTAMRAQESNASLIVVATDDERI
ncbi:MAG: 3-deoxy-manno-octulosonate cytidylyltransferase, partial [Granulosicoccus sp.]